MKPVLLVSFSGGETSAYMARWLQLNMSHIYRLIYVFMNTGAEDPRTLDFVDRCDKEWGLGVVWLEAVIHHGVAKGATHRVVTYESAARNGEPFDDMCSKYGIPNRSYTHCNRELKINPFKSYRRENWPDAQRAIGIRADEIDRMSVHAARDKIVYPLVSMHPVTKRDVIDYWEAADFKLGLPAHRGNCVTCWKKSDRKLDTIAFETPDAFDSFRDMEDKYKDRGSPKNSGVFFRGHRTCDDVILDSKRKFDLYHDPRFSNSDNTSNGCDESCEAHEI